MKKVITAVICLLLLAAFRYYGNQDSRNKTVKLQANYNERDSFSLIQKGVTNSLMKLKLNKKDTLPNGLVLQDAVLTRRDSTLITTLLVPEIRLKSEGLSYYKAALLENVGVLLRKERLSYNLPTMKFRYIYTDNSEHTLFDTTLLDF